MRPLHAHAPFLSFNTPSPSCYSSNRRSVLSIATSYVHQIMVFFSSCTSAKFHAELLNYIDIPCLDIHGKQKQQKRTTTFFEFW
jgi:superfamily II DNA/RNA helicase